MILQELGFHKSAGAQADAYRQFKPFLNKIMNMRNMDDVYNVGKYKRRFEKNTAATEFINSMLDRQPKHKNRSLKFMDNAIQQVRSIFE